MLKRLFGSLFFVIALGVIMGHAQTQVPTTQGTEFWVSFMRNGYRNTTTPNPTKEKLIMIASAKRGCTVTVRNLNQEWEDSFTVGDNGVATFLVPDSRGYNEQQAGNSFKSLLVTSTDTISLYIANEAENSYDAANVLPVEALGCRYMVQSNKSIQEQSSHTNENRASFLVVATEDDTEVQIVPICETWDNHTAGRPYTVTLQRGECYHVLNKNMGTNTNLEGDFSGTWVESLDEEKPIAVFNGNCITSIPGGTTSGFDHVFEQAMPVDNWGKSFVVTSTMAPSYFNLLNDFVKITALYDNTTVMRDGALLCQLNSGESTSFEMNLVNQPCTFIESDNPIAVYLYNHSHQSYGSTYGDPSMVWISPVEQTVREVTFSTFPAANVEKHYVNIVCFTRDMEELTVDNSSISNQFSEVPSNREFSYARIEISNEYSHTIRCPGGFVAHVYGMGPNEGYAYTVGSSAKILTKQLYVNDILSTELPEEGYSTCLEDANLRFRAEFNYEIDHVSWDFGDGSPMEVGVDVSHTYVQPDDYDVVASVYRSMDGVVQLFDELMVSIHVMPLLRIPVIDSTCASVYPFHGKDFPVPYFDEFVVSSDESCDTIYQMNIKKRQSTSSIDTVVICEGEVYTWFDNPYTESNTYMVITNDSYGCDSLCYLDLTVVPNGNDTLFDSACGSYKWNNREYYYDPAEPEVIDSIVFSNEHCESHQYLYLTLYPPQPSFNEIVGLSNVAVASDFWPGKYVYHLDDDTGIDVERITWQWVDDDGPDWMLVPQGDSCMIIAYSMGTKVLQVTSGDGLCEKQVTKTISCYGYGVGEQEAVSLEVYPNPAQNELTVKCSEMEEVSLINLLGQKMMTAHSHGANEMVVEVGHLPQALYLLEVRTPHGNKTRLISVIK